MMDFRVCVLQGIVLLVPSSWLLHEGLLRRFTLDIWRADHGISRLCRLRGRRKLLAWEHQAICLLAGRQA